MKLKQYFDTHPISKAEFANMAGISLRSLFNALDETTDISISIALAIEDLSDGKVKCQDLVSDKFRRQRREKRVRRTKKIALDFYT